VSRFVKVAISGQSIGSGSQQPVLIASGRSPSCFDGRSFARVRSEIEFAGSTVMSAGLGRIRPFAACPQMSCDTVISIQHKPEGHSSLTFDGLKTHVLARADARPQNSGRVRWRI
jgi:hypothetical protein